MDRFNSTILTHIAEYLTPYAFTQFACVCHIFRAATLPLVEQKKLEYSLHAPNNTNRIYFAFRIQSPLVLAHALIAAEVFNLNYAKKYYGANAAAIFAQLFLRPECTYILENEIPRFRPSKRRLSGALKSNVKSKHQMEILELLLEYGHLDAYKIALPYCLVNNPTRLLLAACRSKSIDIVRAIDQEFPHQNENLSKEIRIQFFESTPEITAYFLSRNMIYMGNFSIESMIKTRSQPIDHIVRLITAKNAADIFNYVVDYRYDLLFYYYSVIYKEIIYQFIPSRANVDYFISQCQQYNLNLYRIAKQFLSIDSVALRITFILNICKYIGPLETQEELLVRIAKDYDACVLMHNLGLRFSSEIVQKMAMDLRTRLFYIEKGYNISLCVYELLKLTNEILMKLVHQNISILSSATIVYDGQDDVRIGLLLRMGVQIDGLDKSRVPHYILISLFAEEEITGKDMSPYITALIEWSHDKLTHFFPRRYHSQYIKYISQLNLYTPLFMVYIILSGAPARLELCKTCNVNQAEIIYLLFFAPREILIPFISAEYVSREHFWMWYCLREFTFNTMVIENVMKNYSPLTISIIGYFTLISIHPELATCKCKLYFA